MTQKLYLADAETLNGDAQITAVGDDPRGFFVELDQTWFHAQGGGQKADKGFIDFAVVKHVAHNGDKSAVRHYVNANDFAVGQKVALRVDSAQRIESQDWHTAGHFLAHVAEDIVPALKAVQGHHWIGEGRVEFIYDQIPSDLDTKLPEISGLMQKHCETDSPIIVQGDPFTKRAIKIGHYDAVPCGGTHLTHLSSLSNRIVLLKTKIKDGRLRIGYTLKEAQ